MDAFVQIAQSLGIPVAILAVLGLAIWRILVWIGSNVIKPAMERHMRFLDKVETTMESVTQTQHAIVQHLRHIQPDAAEADR